jgi:Tol biopolymer transport system component
MWIRDGSRGETLPAIDQLDDPRLFPYRWGQALWSYLAGTWGDGIVASVFRESLREGSAIRGIQNMTLLSADDISRDWHAAIHAQYGPTLDATRSASSYGRALSGDGGDEQDMSVSPSLSPDGRRVVYLSQRGLFSIDLYLADVETGAIIRRLVNTTTDQHFASLQFISSAGSWHPGGRQFVFGALTAGQAALAIIDVDNGRVLREKRFPELGEILNPSWSPDGRLIAFSATDGGHSDLFVYDLDADTLRQLTEDSYADLQPSWSPDGQQLAFVTDRYSTDLARLAPGPNGLALLDVATGRPQALPTFDRGKSINPQWAPDGRRISFLSDRTGVTNVYTIDLTSGTITQVTNLNTGVSGITALSPALSSSIDATRLVFSAYDHGNIGVYVIDDPDLAGTALIAVATDLAADALPPQTRATGTLEALLADMTTGLPDTTGESEPYSPRLGLDFVGQPYVSAGVNQFGPTVGGGLSFLWSDMLGNHNLMAAVDINSYGMKIGSIAKNTGGLLAYQNRTRRWNWGVSLRQSPYISGGFLSGVADNDGELAFAQQEIIQRQTYRSLEGGVAYPFSRTFRLELTGGFDRISYDQEVQTQLFSLNTGRLISDETVTTSLADPLNLGTTTVAVVSDSSVFGATSPIAGMRSRISLAPTVGSLDFTGAVADFRRYFMPVDFYTIAGRVMHVGRYGGDSEDSRLLPLFIGYPELVRGYGIGSFSAGSCTVTATGSCDEFDRMLGSRILVSNLEFRFPLLRPFGVRSGMYGPVPIEVGLFADAGVAWSRGERPAFLGGDRQAVSSAGVTFRVNLFGFAIGQIDFVRPFQRREQGWMWQFNLSPGF